MTQPRLILALAMAGALVLLSVTLSSASSAPASIAGVTPPTRTPPAKGCAPASRACMTLEVTEPQGACVGQVCVLDLDAKFTLAVVIEKAPAGGYFLAQSRVDF